MTVNAQLLTEMQFEVDNNFGMYELTHVYMHTNCTGSFPSTRSELKIIEVSLN